MKRLSVYSRVWLVLLFLQVANLGFGINPKTLQDLRDARCPRGLVEAMKRVLRPIERSGSTFRLREMEKLWSELPEWDRIDPKLKSMYDTARDNNLESQAGASRLQTAVLTHWKTLERIAANRAAAILGDKSIDNRALSMSSLGPSVTDYFGVVDLVARMDDDPNLSLLRGVESALERTMGIDANLTELLTIRTHQILDDHVQKPNKSKRADVERLTASRPSNSVAIVLRVSEEEQEIFAKRLNQTDLRTVPLLVIGDWEYEEKIFSPSLRARATLIRSDFYVRGRYGTIRLQTPLIHIFMGMAGENYLFPFEMAYLIDHSIGKQNPVTLRFHFPGELTHSKDWLRQQITDRGRHPERMSKVTLETE